MVSIDFFHKVSGIFRCFRSFTILSTRSNRLFPVTCRPVSTGKDPQSKEHPKMNHYDVLRISPNASPSQIKRAYYKLSLIYHPDKNQGSPESSDKFAAVSEAYQVLSDEKTRVAYDRKLHKHLRTPYYFKEDVLRNHKKKRVKYYDFDEWTRAHYGTVLQESRRRSFARMRFEEHLKKTSQKRMIYNRLMQIGIVLLVLLGGFMSHAKA